MDEEMKRLYIDEGYTLRKVAKHFGVSHHLVRRKLVKMGVSIRQKGGNMRIGPMSEEHKRKISEAAKGRPCYWKGKKIPKSVLYKNMVGHIRWDVTVSFLEQFDDIDKLKCLNKMLSRDRVSEHFDTEKYMMFIKRFYYDKKFCAQFNRFQETGNKYDRPSLDHIVPLSRGGTWDLDNLQIISWFENRAKCDMTWDEYREIVKYYLEC